MAFKIGQKISENGRIGTIVDMRSVGTVDVLFDDMEYAIRRQSCNVKPFRQNGRKRNPRTVDIPSSSIDVDLNKLQIMAQVNGIYKSLVRSFLGLKSNASFAPKGKRIDLKIPQGIRRELLNLAFAYTIGFQREHGYLEPKKTNKPESLVLTSKSLKAIGKRLSKPKEMIKTVDEYEETLRLARKAKRKK